MISLSDNKKEVKVKAYWEPIPDDEGELREGMDLRDAFAISALPSIISSYRDSHLSKYHREVAQEAYLIADEMMEARKK